MARIFYRAGHTVIGADFEDDGIYIPGRFSACISKFYRLPKPFTGKEGVSEEEREQRSKEYIDAILHIVQEEGVELWASVSGEASALEDGEAAELIQGMQGGCKVIQFGHTLTETLHDKFSFIENTRRIGLNVPNTHLVTSEMEALSVLYPDNVMRNSSAESKEKLLAAKSGGAGKKEYIMKSIILDSAHRANMTLLPLSSIRETEAHIKMLNPTPFRPFVLQQFIAGREYCAHSLVIAGEIRAFVACPSKEMLLHYQALPTSSLLSKAMESYLRTYAERTGKEMTGHFSVDFLVEEHIAVAAQGKIAGVREDEVRALMGMLYPIECNPRANTAVVLFSDVSEDLAEVYLSVLVNHEPKGITNGNRRTNQVITPKPGVPGYYWVGHDFVTLVLLPVLALVRREMKLWGVMGNWVLFLQHVWGWRDGVWEVWDPCPFWWMYIGYWPAKLATAIRKGRGGWWGRINLATGKVFGC